MSIQNLINEMQSKYSHIFVERKENLSVEETIETIVSYYEDIISYLPGNVYWLDKNCVAVGCNQNVLDMFGFKDINAFKGLSFEDMGRIGNWSKDAISAFKEDTLQVITTGKPKLNIEDPPVPHANGQLIHFLTSRVPIFDREKNLIGIVGISVDISMLKHMHNALEVARDNAEASSRAKSQFLSVVTHELRTPLTGIVGLLDFLKKEDLPQGEERGLLEGVENCTQHLLSLVTEILEYSKLETGRYSARISIVNLDAVLYEVYGILKTLAKNKGLELRIHTSPDIPENILTDSRILRQILINLVSNAIKFTDTGHITIKITLLSQKHNKAFIQFSVIDTGIGIPANKIELIFEPFHQLEDGYTRQSSRGGTGLGLTIVKKIAEIIDAKIKVKSRQSKGSTFSLIGEFIIAKHSTTTKELTNFSFLENKLASKKKTINNRTNDFNISSDKKPHVLLIEDDPIIQFVHKKMLKNLGCDVDAVSTGYEALNIFAKHDIIFVDISLPDINGFEVIKSIRDRNNNKNVPIVALTVYTGKEEKAASLFAGANEFTSKPISQTRFKKILKRYLIKSNKEGNSDIKISPVV